MQIKSDILHVESVKKVNKVPVYKVHKHGEPGKSKLNEKLTLIDCTYRKTFKQCKIHDQKKRAKKLLTIGSMLASGTKNNVDNSENEELKSLINLVVKGNPKLFKDITPTVKKISPKDKDVEII